MKPQEKRISHASGLANACVQRIIIPSLHKEEV